MSLQPRYRRVLSFGDVLDESMSLFRGHWVQFALVSAFSQLPSGLVLVWLSATGTLYRSFSIADIQSGRAAQATSLDGQLAQLGSSGIYLLVYFLFSMLWAAAVVTASDLLMRGEPVSLKYVYGHAARRYFVLLAGSILVFLALIGLAILATPLFVITGFGVIGSLIAIVGLLFWWLRPTSRQNWLKWLIILTTPFGLPIYAATRWGMYIPAAVLEDRGPVEALRRSGELTDRHWFRVTAILAVASTIVSVLLWVVSALVTIPLTILELTRGQFGLNPLEASLTSAVQVIFQILFASMSLIVYAVLFTDLRNRREGTDIAERLSQLEAAPVSANG